MSIKERYLALEDTLLDIRLINQIVCITVINKDFFPVIRIEMIFADIFFSGKETDFPMPNPGQIIQSLCNCLTEIRNDRGNPVIVYRHIQEQDARIHLIQIRNFLLAEFADTDQTVYILQNVHVIDVAFVGAYNLDIV